MPRPPDPTPTAVLPVVNARTVEADDPLATTLATCDEPRRCTLCGHPIAPGSPRFAWSWSEHPNDERDGVLHAHRGCDAIRRGWLDVGEWDDGEIVTMLGEYALDNGGTDILGTIVAELSPEERAEMGEAVVSAARTWITDEYAENDDE